MKLEIYDKNTRQRLGLIKTYSFVQYRDEFEGVGKFSIKLPSTEKSIQYLTRGNYIWFEKDIVGIVKYKQQSKRDDSGTVTIEGPLCKKLLDYRVSDKTSTYSGGSAEITKKLTEDYFIAPADEKRRMSEITFFQGELPETPSISHQTTGKTIHSSMTSVLSRADLGVRLKPIFVDYDESSDQNTNISSFEVNVVKPTDRTLGNSEGNTPVLFSAELDNLTSLLYEEDDSLFCSTLYVAGEGEGVDREVLELGDTEASGVDRIEGYSDARDIQRLQSDGSTLTDEQYTQALRNRGEQDLSLYTASTLVQGTILENGMYTFGVDYFLGDRITLRDDQFGVQVDVPISAVVCSHSQQVGKLYDFVFGYEKATIKKILKTKGVM